MPGAYPRRSGDYSYVVIVTKDDLQPLPQRYRARLTNVQRITGGLFDAAGQALVQVDVPDGHGSTGSEAIEALELAFVAWQRQD
jgi:hypothetical protein